jgi:TetR/AcrR family transcriptional regulator, transcriptional repressor for nem operon
LIRERGIASVSIADVMGAVDLTVGGFYRHFDSKEALVSEAIEAASLETVGEMTLPSHGSQGPAEFRAAVARYVSRDHIADPGRGCPVAALAAEAAREAKATRAAMQRAVGRVVAMLEADGPKTKRERRRMFTALSTAVGAVILGRVLKGTRIGDELVASVRAELLEGD